MIWMLTEHYGCSEKTMANRAEKRNLDITSSHPDPDMDHHINLIECFLDQDQTVHEMSSKSVYNFFRYIILTDTSKQLKVRKHNPPWQR